MPDDRGHSAARSLIKKAARFSGFLILRALLTRSPTFFAAIAFLFLLSGVNLYWFRYDFSVLAQQLLQRDEELARWQQWARHYDRLFGMLAWGERVGIQREGQHSVGIVIERTPEGVVARRSLFLRRERPGVVLTLQQQTAEDLLASVPHTDPEAIWQMVKDRLYARQITVWSDADIGRLQRGGYLAFMRAIDTRPPNTDWPRVKSLLGEK